MEVMIAVWADFPFLPAGAESGEDAPPYLLTACSGVPLERYSGRIHVLQ